MIFLCAGFNIIMQKNEKVTDFSQFFKFIANTPFFSALIKQEYGTKGDAVSTSNCVVFCGEFVFCAMFVTLHVVQII
jgi:hypothetical protein